MYRRIINSFTKWNNIFILLLLLFSLFINDIVKVLKYSECLLLADDTKLFKKINCIEDSNNIQIDLENFYKWYRENGMTLNINKCSTVSYSFKKTTLYFDYSLNKHSLTHNDTIKDLGVIFDSKLSFNKHVSYVRNKSFIWN